MYVNGNSHSFWAHNATAVLMIVSVEINGE